MGLRFFMDHNVRSAVTAGLRLRGIDVLSAHEDGSHELADPALLDRAVESGRALVTHDDDFLAEATARQRSALKFPGITWAHQEIGIGKMVADLELIAGACEPEELADTVTFLPLR